MITHSIQGLQNFTEEFSMENPAFVSLINQIKEMVISINTFIKFITLIKGMKYENEMAEIFRRLFKMSFHPPQQKNNYETIIYPVYNIFFDFFNMKSNIINFKSSTGSGKTRCAPFMFSILSYYEELNIPFFIMTQPGKTIIDDKLEDFKNFFGDTVILETDPRKYLEYYELEEITKPIIGLFSPRSLLVLFSKANKKHIRIFKKTRFCLDEIHERDKYTDVVISRLAENCPPYKIQKHIMMMSATPDKRILNVFRGQRYIKRDLILSDKLLFPIKDISQQVKKVDETVKEAVKNTIKIVDDMTTDKSLQGHILIFTSGRQRISDIQIRLIAGLKDFIKDQSKRDRQNAQQVIILLNSENSMNDQQSFNNYLKENVLDRDKLYILIIPFISYVPPFQKQIAKGNIQNYNNIIKIVIATNAIESSITIDKMAAVIDCGIMNVAEYNSLIGVTNLVEFPITKQNQMQRRGRVGRVMPGKSFQITVQDLKIPDYLEPEILTSDISAFILDLRRIGIRFETLYRLPNKIPKNKVHSIIEMLKKIGALNTSTGSLTDDGFLLSSFRSFSPFISSAILNLSRDHYKGEVTPMILGALCIKLISDDIIINNICPKFVQNFNFESDLDTIMKTFIEMVLERRKITEIAPDFGFHPKKATQIVGEIFELSEMFDKGNTEELWTNLYDFYLNCDFVHTFCSLLFDEIEKNSENGEWIKVRKAELDFISNTKFEPEFRFKADDALKFDESEKSYIVTRNRPGSLNLNIPSNVLILNIQRNTNKRINYGTMIHIDTKAEQKYKHFAKNIPALYDTPFFIPMMNGFISDFGRSMLKFNMIGSSLKFVNGTNYFAFSRLNNHKEICLNAFLESNYYDEIVNYINEGLKIVSDLAPFTPQTILVKHPTMEFCCALKGYGIDKIDFDIINLNEPSFNAYHVNEKTIRYIHSKKDELCKQSSNCTIAITGQDMSFPDNQDDKKFISFPHTFAKCENVFGSSKDYSHLIIISKERIRGADSINWKMKEKISKIQLNQIEQIEEIFPNGVKITKKPWVIFFPKGYTIMYHPAAKNSYYESKKSLFFAPIIEEYSANCVKDKNLIKDIDLEIEIDSEPFKYNQATELRSYLNKKNQMPTIRDLNELKEMLIEDPEFYIEMAKYHCIDERLLNIDNVNLLLNLEKISDQFKSMKSVQFINNCAAFAINGDAKILRKFIESMKQFKSSKYEILDKTYEVEIKNLVKFNLKKGEFMKRVQSVLGHFSGVIFKVSSYRRSINRYLENGYVTVTVPFEFLEPLIAMLRDNISNEFILKIPEEIVPSYFLKYGEVIDKLSKYFASKNISLINNDYDFYGFLEDIKRAEISLIDDPPKLPVYSIKIPSDCNIKSLEIALKSQSSLYKLDKRYNFLIVPIDEEAENVNNFIDKFGRRGMLIGKTVPDCFGDDVLMHNDPKLHSNESINVYFKECIVSRPICLQCAKESIAYNLGKIIDLKGNINISRALSNFEHINIYSIHDFPSKNDQSNGIWPIAPLGHLIWILLSSPISKKETKAYITALASLAFHKSPLFTFCPNHPENLIVKNRYIDTHCLKKSCCMILCVQCGQWHPHGKCASNELPVGYRQCPFCHKVIEKIKDCNHIECSCGKHFCYYCGKGFNEHGDVYRHMEEENHINDPPDYLCYVKHLSVSDETLREFYQKFPDIRKFVKDSERELFIGNNSPLLRLFWRPK